jgi:hypothetical protein
MKVSVDISREDMDGDYGTIEGVRATCTRCGHATESFGTSDRSVKRCLVLMREECPEGEENFYVSANDEGDT